MAIRGAIFDFDGTLVDSMPMWTDVCVRLLRRHGVEDAERIFAERESLDMEQKCVWYHENLGIGESPAELYEELREDVLRAYRQEVRRFSGCRHFLEELRARGVPMVIASATPADLLREGLEAQGLAEFFQDVVFAGDVGMSKDHPHVYVAACERLGTDRESTWVFEDAPFGVRAAARAGFPTAALFNDHDGRDERFLRRWATVVLHGYENLHAADLEGLAPRTLHALIVGGSPQPSSVPLVSELAARADIVIAADGGANVLMSAGVAPNAFCGDEDSVSSEASAWAHEHADKVVRHPVEKDDTDLGLCVALAREEADGRGAALRLTFTCVSGGRSDHALAVWGVLARAADASPAIEEDDYNCQVLSPIGMPEYRLENHEGTTLSAIALASDTVASAWGMRWNLDHDPLEPLSDLGISNRVTSANAGVCCHSGVLAVMEVHV